MKPLTLTLVFIALTGCATTEEVAEHCSIGPDSGNLVCEDIPPEAETGQVCDKLANNMYYCHKPI